MMYLILIATWTQVVWIWLYSRYISMFYVDRFNKEQVGVSVWVQLNTNTCALFYSTVQAGQAENEVFNYNSV